MSAQDIKDAALHIKNRLTVLQSYRDLFEAGTITAYSQIRDYFDDHEDAEIMNDLDPRQGICFFLEILDPTDLPDDVVSNIASVMDSLHIAYGNLLGSKDAYPVRGVGGQTNGETYDTYMDGEKSMYGDDEYGQNRWEFIDFCVKTIDKWYTGERHE